MSATQFPAAIPSRPVYGVLEYRPGKAHLMIADAEGGQALLDMVAVAPAGMMATAHIIYISKNTGAAYVAKFEALNPAQFYQGSSYPASVSRLRRVLSASHMGLQVYLAGTEGLIGQAMYEATEAGIPHTAIQTEHRGSLARRVQCVHCKGITEDVTTDPDQCAHCGLHLYVRDHYSRRIAAFQGVRIDAEDPGNIPVALERFT